jgi:hypothetical protein
MNSQLGTAFSLDAHVRNLQIIKFGLISGVVIFAIVIVFAIPKPNPPADPLFVWIMAGFGVIAVLARMVVPRLLVKAGVQRIATGAGGSPDSSQAVDAALAGLYQVQMIVGSAILEGGAFGNLASCLMTGHALSWVVTGFLWLGLVFDFPTRSAVERWIAEKRTWIGDERSLANLRNPAARSFRDS